MNDIIKVVQAVEDTNILLKGVTKTIKNETNIIRRRVFKHGIRYFRSQSVRNLLSGKGIARAGSGNIKGKGIARAGYGKE